MPVTGDAYNLVEHFNKTLAELPPDIDFFKSIHLLREALYIRANLPSTKSDVLWREVEILGLGAGDLLPGLKETLNQDPHLAAWLFSQTYAVPFLRVIHHHFDSTPLAHEEIWQTLMTRAEEDVACLAFAPSVLIQNAKTRQALIETALNGPKYGKPFHDPFKKGRYVNLDPSEYHYHFANDGAPAKPLFPQNIAISNPYDGLSQVGMLLSYFSAPTLLLVIFTAANAAVATHAYIAIGILLGCWAPIPLVALICLNLAYQLAFDESAYRFCSQNFSPLPMTELLALKQDTIESLQAIAPDQSNEYIAAVRRADRLIAEIDRQLPRQQRVRQKLTNIATAERQHTLKQLFDIKWRAVKVLTEASRLPIAQAQRYQSIIVDVDAVLSKMQLTQVELTQYLFPENPQERQARIRWLISQPGNGSCLLYLPLDQDRNFAVEILTLALQNGLRHYPPSPTGFRGLFTNKAKGWELAVLKRVEANEDTLQQLADLLITIPQENNTCAAANILLADLQAKGITANQYQGPTLC